MAATPSQSGKHTLLSGIETSSIKGKRGMIGRVTLNLSSAMDYETAIQPTGILIKLTKSISEQASIKHSPSPIVQISSDDVQIERRSDLSVLLLRKNLEGCFFN